MSQSRKVLMSSSGWKQWYHSTTMSVIRHVLALLLFITGIAIATFALNAEHATVWGLYLISAICFLLAMVFAFTATVFLMAGAIFTAITQSLPVSTAIMLGALIIAGIIYAIHEKKN